MTREEAIKILKDENEMQGHFKGFSMYSVALEMAISALSEEPIRPKGEWEHWKGEKFFDVPVCSNCGMTFSVNARGWSFCPNCGADMRGE